MADEPRSPTPTPTPTRGTGRGSVTRTPRWVYIFGIVFVMVLVGLLVIQHLVFGGMEGHIS